MEDIKLSNKQVILSSLIIILLGTIWFVIKYTSYVFIISGWIGYLFGVNTLSFNTCFQIGCILAGFKFCMVAIKSF